MSSTGIQYGKRAHFALYSSSAPEKRRGNYSITLPHSFANKPIQLEALRDGISLCVSNFHVEEDMTVPFQVSGGAVSIVVAMTGQSTATIGKSISMITPSDLVLWHEECEGNTFFKRGDFCGVGVYLAKDVLLELTEGDPSFAGLESIFYGQNSSRLFNINDPSPVSRLIARQMLACPWSGSCRKVFLESKTLELIAYTLRTMVCTRPENKFFLSRSDVERLHEAKRLLLKDLVNPPSIQKLSRMTGINEFKLKKGFRELFGNTVYQSLRSYRMEVAKGMLENPEVTVSEVASMVGYTNMSHFSAAFRQHFGVNPGLFLRQFRRLRSADC